MQISRHWRLNAQRYRLEGVRLQNGEVRLQNRLADNETEGPKNLNKDKVTVRSTQTQIPVTLS